MADRPVFVFVGAYDSKEGAAADYQVVKELPRGAIGGFDAAVITKDEQGKVRVNKDETATRRGGWTGLGVGAVVGILFPPSLIASAAVGAGAGALTGHLARGMSRGDMKDLGEMLDEGEAALVVVGEDRIEEAIAKEAKRANRMLEKEIDAEAEDLRKELRSRGRGTDDGEVAESLKRPRRLFSPDAQEREPPSGGSLVFGTLN